MRGWAFSNIMRVLKKLVTLTAQPYKLNHLLTTLLNLSTIELVKVVVGVYEGRTHVQLAFK